MAPLLDADSNHEMVQNEPESSLAASRVALLFLTAAAIPVPIRPTKQAHSCGHFEPPCMENGHELRARHVLSLEWLDLLRLARLFAPT